jgi:hypothetical protein
MTTPGLDNLTNSMIQLQNSITSNQNQTRWTNITFSACRDRYKEGTFDKFSNVILISNWTSPSNTNNSALELTILTGHAGPKHQKHQSLVSLCPQSFFSTHNITEPQKWEYVASKPHGLFDSYAPKKFPLATQNVFVKSCYSQDVPQKCRLLYSPLIMKIATVCLMVTVACMTLAIFFHERSQEPEGKNVFVVFVATGVVAVAYVIQLIVMGLSSAAQRSPKNKRLVLGNSLGFS